jgi:urate oxidase
MIGYCKKKLYVAILGSSKKELADMTHTIKSWYAGIKIKTFIDSGSLFEAISLNKLQNHPFDMVYVNSDKQAEKMIINRTMPEIPVMTHNSC